MSIKLNVLVNDKAITEYSHEGDTYVEGRPGSEYKIKITNQSYKRLKVVLSVDGLSVIDGSPAGENSQGYILGGKESITVPGWLVSGTSAAKFVFGSKKNSYSNKAGQGTNNVGVIGAMVFEEQYNYPIGNPYANLTPWYPTQTNPTWGGISTTTPMMSLSTTTPTMSLSSGLGTGMGEDTSFETTSGYIQAKSTPSEIVTVYYDDIRGLKARGIVVDQRKLKPSAFPASTQFCKRV